MILWPISIYCNHVCHWETHVYAFSLCLPIGALITNKNNIKRNIPVSRMSCGEFKMAPAKRELVIRCDISTLKFTTINASFKNTNKSSVPANVLEQFEAAVSSTSFVTVDEIYSGDVSSHSNQNATVLSPIANSLCSGLTRSRSNSTSKPSQIRAPIQRHNRCVLSTTVSWLLKENSNDRQTTND